MTFFLLTLLGLCLGSFISMLSYRLPLGKEMVVTPSACPVCHTKLGIKNLIPLFSWLLSNGRCNHCSTRISIRYPLIEIGTAFSLLMIYSFLGLNHLSIFFMILALVLIVIIIIDFEHYIIPDTLQIATLLLALYFAYLFNYSLSHIVTGAAAGFFSSYLLAKSFALARKKEGLGFGDVKFIGSVGIFLGAQNLVLFYLLSGLLGTANGLIWQHILKKPIFPFAPSLAISLFLCLILPFIFGNSWYQNFNLLDTLIFGHLVN